MEYIVFGVEGLAFSFDDPEQDASKGYSFYSYGSDKNQFINFAQLMMHEFQEQKPRFEKVCHGLLEVLLVYISRKQNLSVISTFYHTSTVFFNCHPLKPIIQSYINSRNCSLYHNFIRKLSNYIAKPIYKWSFKHEENIIVSWCCLHLFL